MSQRSVCTEHLRMHSFFQFMRRCHFYSFALRSVGWLGCSFKVCWVLSKSEPIMPKISHAAVPVRAMLMHRLA